MSWLLSDSGSYSLPKNIKKENAVVFYILQGDIHAYAENNCNHHIVPALENKLMDIKYRQKNHNTEKE